ncbi:polysaccharide pyruvyl transferase family protein [Pseudoalteromonas espejiana]
MPDIVMGFPVEKYKSIKSEKCVSISVTKVEKDGKGNISSTPYIDEIRQWVSFYITAGYTIEFVSFEDSVDLDVVSLILSSVNNEYLDKIKVVQYKKDDALISLAKAEIVISTRFHSMVLAALLNKKQVIYSYSDKTSNFASDYGFIVHPVTGTIEGKSAYQTAFEQSDIDLAKTYPNFLMSK